MTKIEETTQRSFKTMLPGVIETLKKEFIQIVTVRVDEAVQAMKEDVLKELKQKLKFIEERTHLHPSGKQNFSNSIIVETTSKSLEFHVNQSLREY